MPVVNKTSNLFVNPHDGDTAIDPMLSAGRIKVATGTVTNAATDSNESSYKIAELPADCILHEDTKFDVENDGFAAIRIGTKTDVDALVSVAKTDAAIQSPIAFGDANHGKRLWEVLGLAANPGGFIALYKHAIADAAGAGSMPFRIVYITN